MYKDKCFREKYHEARRKAIASGIIRDGIKGNVGEAYSFEMLAALRDMAENDVYPDGSFSDKECCAWEMFC